jgi:transcriptional regulator with XRE-family HTH domain
MTQDTEQLFAEKVKWFRTQLALKQSEFAQQLTAAGVPFTQQQVARLEAAARPIRLNEAAAIAQVLGVSMKVLLPVQPQSDDERRVSNQRDAVENTREHEKVYEQSLELLRAVEEKLIELQNKAKVRRMSLEGGGAAARGDDGEMATDAEGETTKSTRETTKVAQKTTKAARDATKAVRRNNKAKAGER